MSEPQPPKDEDDLLAAEYVIGLLEAADRRAVEARARRDDEFMARIAMWESHLEDLNEDYGTQIPPKAVKDRIDRRLFATPGRRWTLWRPLGLAAALMLVGLVAFQALRVPAYDLQARLSSDTTAFVFDVSVAQSDSEVVLSVTDGTLPVDRTFELWLIPADGVPVSLGTFASDTNLRLSNPQALQARATLAVSLEPPGGSPTGAPTGPVLAVGTLEDA